MVLIIAEKPSLAKNIVAGISAKMDRKDGYYIGGDYIVSWHSDICFLLPI